MGRGYGLHEGGGGITMTYAAIFFHCLRGQLLMVNDYAYAGVEFRGDPNLSLPEGEQRDD